MNMLWLAYFALAGGLMGFGGIFVALGLRRHVGPTSLAARVAMALTLLVAVAGTTVAVILEARAANPW